MNGITKTETSELAFDVGRQVRDYLGPDFASLAFDEEALHEALEQKKLKLYVLAQAIPAACDDLEHRAWLTEQCDDVMIQLWEDEIDERTFRDRLVRLAATIVPIKATSTWGDPQ